MSRVITLRMVTAWLRVTWPFAWRDHPLPFWSRHVTSREKKSWSRHVTSRDQITACLSRHVTACRIFPSLWEHQLLWYFKVANLLSIVFCFPSLLDLSLSNMMGWLREDSDYFVPCGPNLHISPIIYLLSYLVIIHFSSSIIQILFFSRAESGF